MTRRWAPNSLQGTVSLTSHDPCSDLINKTDDRMPGVP